LFNSVSAIVDALRSLISRSTLDDLVVSVSPETQLSKLLERAIRFLLSKLSWLGVRTTGNLQILTRASYYSLFVVPIIAGIWPFIRNTLNRYNESVQTAAKKAISAAETLEAKLEQLKRAGEPVSLMQSLADGELRSVSEDLREISENYTYLINDTNMPTSLAFAFFAALLVATGHLLYQVFCPEQVKIANLDEYVSQQITAARSRSVVSLFEDIEFVAIRSGLSPDDLISEFQSPSFSSKDLVRKVGENEKYEAVHRKDPPRFVSSTHDSRVDRNPETQTRVADIAARLRYAKWITESLPAALLAVSSYFAATILIIVIVFEQVLNVISAVGWIR
jgi:hypothetical protein